MDLKKKKKSPFREQSSQKADWNETVELTLPWVFPEPRLQTERPEKVSVCSVSAVAHRYAEAWEGDGRGGRWHLKCKS